MSGELWFDSDLYVLSVGVNGRFYARFSLDLSKRTIYPLLHSLPIQNKECPSSTFFAGAAISVVKDDGKLSDLCVYCDGGPKRTSRKRSRNAKYTE